MKKAETILLLKENDRGRYVADVLAKIWSASGYRVLHHSGTHHPPSADIVFLHVDKTIVPEEYAQCVSRYPVAINGKALNITRTIYSTARLKKDDGYEGPVIVKTVHNYGGLPEHRSVSFRIPLITRFMKFDESSVRRPMGTCWRNKTFLDPLEYPIFEHKDCLPSDVWENKNLIVEKFIPEKEGDVYFVRYWQFLGDKSITGRFGSKHPIVKYHRRVTEVLPIDVPEELVLWREKLHLDYGRFDYLMHEGKPVLLDANKTQGFGPRSHLTLRKAMEKFADFSKGIEHFIKRL